jgi:hypothetical protein
MCQLYFFIAIILAKLGDAVPQTPWDFSLFPCSSRRGERRSRAASGEDRPALLLFAGSRSALRLRPRRALSSAEAPPAYQSRLGEQGGHHRNPVLRTSGFENYKVSGFANNSRPVLIAPRQHQASSSGVVPYRFSRRLGERAPSAVAFFAPAQAKAPEGRRTPRPGGFSLRPRSSRSVLECGRPLPLSHHLVAPMPRVQASGGARLRMARSMLFSISAGLHNVGSCVLK